MISVDPFSVDPLTVDPTIRSTDRGRELTDQPINGSTDQRADQPINRSTVSGITLIEMLVVMAVVAVMMAITYPNFTAGLEGIRLKSAASRAGAFWSSARQRSDRFQEVVQVVVDPEKRELRARSTEGGWRDALSVDDGLFVASPEQAHSWILYPGTPSPRFELLLGGGDGGRAGIRVNVLTGVPEEWKP